MIGTILWIITHKPTILLGSIRGIAAITLGKENEASSSNLTVVLEASLFGLWD
ncbi:hypothetical protein FHS14_000272 [Paenibacillus baekrokdamisoli]|nr:hypothetical protein [Paenibacillus baekrokdamisoli]MBB3067302.1 hypothetical protein [Paenibacillus baekrokdamisoli]